MYLNKNIFRPIPKLNFPVFFLVNIRIECNCSPSPNIPLLFSVFKTRQSRSRVFCATRACPSDTPASGSTSSSSIWKPALIKNNPIRKFNETHHERDWLVQQQNYSENLICSATDLFNSIAILINKKIIIKA